MADNKNGVGRKEYKVVWKESGPRGTTRTRERTVFSARKAQELRNEKKAQGFALCEPSPSSEMAIT